MLTLIKICYSDLKMLQMRSMFLQYVIRKWIIPAIWLMTDVWRLYDICMLGMLTSILSDIRNGLLLVVTVIIWTEKIFTELWHDTIQHTDICSQTDKQLGWLKLLTAFRFSFCSTFILIIISFLFIHSDLKPTFLNLSHFIYLI